MENKQTKEQDSEQLNEKKDGKFKSYLKKLGIAGFAFFFIKGLVWIAVFAFGFKGCEWLTQN